MERIYALQLHRPSISYCGSQSNISQTPMHVHLLTYPLIQTMMMIKKSSNPHDKPSIPPRANPFHSFECCTPRELQDYSHDGNDCMLKIQITMNSVITILFTSLFEVDSIIVIYSLR